MQDAFTYVISTVVDLYITAIFLRLVLQWSRADFRNPMAQFVLRVTNPIVLPLRRIVPAIGSLDTATVVALLAVSLLATGILVKIACVGSADAGQMLALTFLRLIHLLLRTYSLLILVYVILSWVGSGGYNPVAAMLASAVEPVLRPLQRVIPPIGGLDLSPVVALIAIEFFNRLIPSGPLAAGLMCLPL
jgi:YggT family protein